MIFSDTKPISIYSIVMTNKYAVFADLAGEGVILEPESGMYYGLNQVGTRIWELIQEPTTVRALRDVILAEYEVEREQCEREILALLQDMAAKGLVGVKDGPDA
jgi:hypothetical protein